MKLIKHEGLKRVLQVAIAISTVAIVWHGFARDYENAQQYFLVTPEHTLEYRTHNPDDESEADRYTGASLPLLLRAADPQTTILFKNAFWPKDMEVIWAKVSLEERLAVGDKAKWFKRKLIAASIGWGLAYLAAISLALVLLINAFGYIREGFRTAGKPS